MDNKLYRVRLRLNVTSHGSIQSTKYLTITDYCFKWTDDQLSGTELDKEDAETFISLLKKHIYVCHACDLVEVEPVYVIKFKSNKKIASYFNGVSCDGSNDLISWVNELEEVTCSFDKDSAIKHQVALKTLLDIETELVEYYEDR